MKILGLCLLAFMATSAMAEESIVFMGRGGLPIVQVYIDANHFELESPHCSGAAFHLLLRFRFRTCCCLTFFPFFIVIAYIYVYY